MVAALTFVFTSEMRMCASFWLQILSSNLQVAVAELTAGAVEVFEALNEGPDCTRQKGKVSMRFQFPLLPRHHFLIDERTAMSSQSSKSD